MWTLANLSAGGQPLSWRQPEIMRRYYELCVGDQWVAATLERQRGFRAPALIEAATGRWLVERSGTWRRRVTVRWAESQEEVATYQADWGNRGTLTFVQGPSYLWKSSNFWRTRWAWHAPDGTPLIHVVNRQRLMRMEGEIGVEPAALRLRELDLLVALGWYLLIMIVEDSSSAATAGTTASVAATVSS